MHYLFPVILLLAPLALADDETVENRGGQKKGLCELDVAVEPSTGHTQSDPSKLNKIQLEKLTHKDSNVVKLMFLFTDRGESDLTYFKYYDKKKRALIIDIYNNELGDEVLRSLSGASSLKSEVEEFQVDLNQEVAGLKPDVRNVIRLSLFLRKPAVHQIDDEDGVGLNVSWKKPKRANWKDFLPYL